MREKNQEEAHNLAVRKGVLRREKGKLERATKREAERESLKKALREGANKINKERGTSRELGQERKALEAHAPKVRVL